MSNATVTGAEFKKQSREGMPKMGLYEKYEFPHMHTSPELNEATQTLVKEARKNAVIPSHLRGLWRSEKITPRFIFDLCFPWP